ncbi:ATP-dependent RNA helicase DeaD [Cytobacillus eiseniae]|uniref:ATP-dependent RNA helicase DeaD n=1 Tax=Cytobacillus eiseniae TaxID=762947 RepID=A0ABS4RA80_9BACI|nr:DEAD/DEAH box helicase [Cytobacillus eiseniae]MBP2239802.1 ATP-dependent RNA helicase DeaD [Cytobacillus eiseniae]
MPDFSSLGISQALAAILHKSAIATPTPIQIEAIPMIMNGTDLIAQSETGSGKTLAFVLPILEKIDSEASYIQSLIVTPTRELALQITNEIEKLVQHIDNIDVLAVYGGQDVEKQLKKLKKNIQIVVGTPGRLLDHIRRKTIQLDQVSFLILDEADQMLHIGFLNEVEEIIRETPTSRQTLLFSATIPAEIKKLAAKHMKKPAYIQIEKTQGPAENVEQIAIHMTDRAKQGTLISLVETHQPFLAVIFCRTKRRVSRLNEILKANDFDSDELHGDLSQAKREQVMKRFRKADFQLLIATDVAARGLDIEGVTHVYNYDIPQDAESYVHRIGRTGRAGMKGLAVTFYTDDDKAMIELIEKELQITIPKKSMEKKEEKQKQKITRKATHSPIQKERTSNNSKRKTPSQWSKNSRGKQTEASKARRGQRQSARNGRGK